MEKDSPRKQPQDEVQRHIEARFRDAGEQGADPETELESVSDRWRTERRQLNADVDRLERTADDKMREATKAWDVEREKLIVEISRLQGAVGDLIERSNNPMRASMSIREDLETRLSAAIHAKDRVESAYLIEKASWDSEKDRLTAELIPLRRSAAQSKAPRGKLGIDDRAKELENRIAALQKEMNHERAEWRAQIQQMELQIAGTRQAVNTELDRVQKMTREITKQIGDPSSDLSTVIRKNVELAELNAYLKGIQYSMGNSKGIK